MVLQTPPMTFASPRKDSKFAPSQYEIGYSKPVPGCPPVRPSDPNARVSYTIHPALYQGKTLLKKGSVVLYIPEGNPAARAARRQRESSVDARRTPKQLQMKMTADI